MTSNNQTEITHKVIRIFGRTTDIYAIAAVFSTSANFTLGLLISVGILTGHPINKILALRMVMLGASFDAIDGRLARRSNFKPKFGAQYDTIADQTTFGLAPTMMIFHIFNKLNYGFSILLAGIYLFAATYRLSRFMVEPTYGFFNGMPSPVAATFIAAWYMQPNLDPVLFSGAIALISTVMIVRLPYTAMKSVTTLFQKANFVFTIAMMLLITYSPSSWMHVLSTIWILYILYFIFIGPIQAQKNMK